MVANLTDLPKIGKAIAADLMSIGIGLPEDLEGRDPLKMFNELKVTMGHRYDPCVYYTLLSVQHSMTKANPFHGGGSQNRARWI
jgi:DNA transformation protein